MRFSKLLLTLVAGFGLLLGTAHADVPKNIIDTLNENVVQVGYHDDGGSGFYVSSQLLITNRHVVSAAENPLDMEQDPLITIVSVDKEDRYVVTLVEYFTNADVALLYCKLCPADSGKGLAIANNLPATGTSVYLAGFGLMQYGVQTGHMQGLIPGNVEKDIAPDMSHSADTAQGDSGGPVVVLVEGEVIVVGVVRAIGVGTIPVEDGYDLTLVSHKARAVPARFINQLMTHVAQPTK